MRSTSCSTRSTWSRRLAVSADDPRPAGAEQPPVLVVDDATGETLIQRDDDKEETVRKRLDVYSAQTRPLVDYYANWAKTGDAAAPLYRAIAGIGTVDEIKDRAFTALAS